MQQTPLQQACLARLNTCAHRLLRLIELGAPSVIIANEVSMIVRYTAALHGGGVFESAARSVAQYERWAMGYCREENCGAKLVNQEEMAKGLCKLHLERDETVGEEEQSDDYPEGEAAEQTNSLEKRIYDALVALLDNYEETGSVVLIEEPKSHKFIQFGPGSSLEIDVPHVVLTSEEAARAYGFFARLGDNYLIEYDAPDPRTGEIHHGATFNHKFGKDARKAAEVAVSFFREVYLFPPRTELLIKRVR
jgi:hypothetical protein